MPNRTPSKTQLVRGRCDVVTGGKVRATWAVEPIRDKRGITAIKGLLADSPRDYALFVVGIHTGYRGCDLLGVKWGDVVDVQGDIADRIALRESKTGKARGLRLQDNAVRALTRLRSSLPSFDLEAYVFKGREGKGRLSTQRLNQLVKAWTSGAGIEGHFGVHTLRKTFGYHLRKAGYDISMLMEIYGHTSPAVTRRYLGITQDEIDEAALKLSL